MIFVFGQIKDSQKHSKNISKNISTNINKMDGWMKDSNHTSLYSVLQDGIFDCKHG